MKAPAKILMVDDDLEDHFILQEYFADAGLADLLEFTQNGKEALEMLDKLEEEHLPKLVLLDLNMPILNGTQTLLQIKRSSRLKHLLVIIYSTSENEDEKRKCLTFGAHNYIVKPSTFNEGTQIVKYLNSLLLL